MDNNPQNTVRRTFLKSALATAVVAALPTEIGRAKTFSRDSLQVWSCGGLAEAFMPANDRYEQQHGIKISYTGAFAAALGKSLLGSATTEIFGGRVLDLAKKLKSSGKMLYFKPLCFTSYVMVTPLANPAGIEKVTDLARPGVRVILAPEASPPGGQAVQALLKKAGILDSATKNCVLPGSCVQRTMDDIINGKGDVSVVELRLTRMAAFAGKTTVIPIPEEFFPPPPLTFTIGVMKDAADRALADHYLQYITSEEGQAFFAAAGFIPAISDKGRELVEKLGVKDV
jgi:molybdate transport system substrate-binding protein